MRSVDVDAGDIERTRFLRRGARAACNSSSLNLEEYAASIVVGVGLLPGYGVSRGGYNNSSTTVVLLRQ